MNAYNNYSKAPSKMNSSNRIVCSKAVSTFRIRQEGKNMAKTFLIKFNIKK